jgi:hypothetical protein
MKSNVYTRYLFHQASETISPDHRVHTQQLSRSSQQPTVQGSRARAVSLAWGATEQHWSWEVPAPLLVRETGSAATTKFKLLASGKGVTGSVEEDQFVAKFAMAETQALWSYTF